MCATLFIIIIIVTITKLAGLEETLLWEAYSENCTVNIVVKVGIGSPNGIGSPKHKHQCGLGKANDNKSGDTATNDKYIYCKKQHQSVCNFKDKEKEGNKDKAE